MSSARSCPLVSPVRANRSRRTSRRTIVSALVAQPLLWVGLAASGASSARGTRFRVDELQSALKLIDLSRFLAGFEQGVQGALRARGLSADRWIVELLAEGGSKTGIPGVGPSDVIDLASGGAGVIKTWMDEVWRPALSSRAAALGVITGSRSLPTCAPPGDTLETATTLIWTLTAGKATEPTFDGRRPRFGDPRLMGAFKEFVGHVAKALGFGGKDGSRDGSGSGGGVRGQPLPEGGGSTAAPDQGSIWWLMVQIGSRWGRINSKMGPPRPVDPGPDPGSGRDRTVPANPRTPSGGDPRVVNPNPSRPSAGVAPPPGARAPVGGGKVPGPDPAEPAASGPPVPAPR